MEEQGRGDVKCNVRRKEIIWIEEGDIFRAAFPKLDGKQRGSEDNEVQGKQRLGGWKEQHDRWIRCARRFTNCALPRISGFYVLEDGVFDESSPTRHDDRSRLENVIAIMETLVLDIALLIENFVFFFNLFF